MLKATQVGDVTEIKMGRSLDGETVLYWVAAYLIDGILIDTGCDYTKNELAEFLDGKQVSKLINTHYHEDHVGGNAILAKRFGLKAIAHPETVRLMSGKHDLYPFELEVWGPPIPAPPTRWDPQSKKERSACMSSRPQDTAKDTCPYSRRTAESCSLATYGLENVPRPREPKKTCIN